MLLDELTVFAGMLGKLAELLAELLGELTDLLT